MRPSKQLVLHISPGKPMLQFELCVVLSIVAEKVHCTVEPAPVLLLLLLLLIV